MSFFADPSNQRKIALALAAFLGLFGKKVPFLADVSPEMLMTVIAAISTWVLQSGYHSGQKALAAAQAASNVTTPAAAVAAINQVLPK